MEKQEIAKLYFCNQRLNSDWAKSANWDKPEQHSCRFLASFFSFSTETGASFFQRILLAFLGLRIKGKVNELLLISKNNLDITTH